MKITFDPAQAARCARELDLADAGQVFERPHLTNLDDREDYGEDRFVTIGFKGDTLVVLVWTPRGDSRRVISMRTANATEEELFTRYVR